MAVSIENIEKQFNNLRQNLLDLSMRNQLLNFRPRTRSIKVIDEITTEIYDILVLNEQIMEFLPIPEQDEDNEKENNGEQQTKLNLSKEESDELWELPSPNIEVDERHKDLFLQTSLASKDLQKRLFNIFQQASSVFNEQGYNILYLGLGFLEWKESPDSIDHRTAPLLLIPVELNRKGVKKSFELNWNGEDIVNNISLQSKLKEQGIDLPNFEMPDEKDGIYDYFKQVESSISEMEEWNVKHDIYLGFFSFAKFVMYQDLDRSNWPDDFSFDDSPIIKALFDSEEISVDVGFFEGDIDKLLPSKNLFTVLDADSSQLAVIEDVKSGKNLVVEGPPGTGKSQTIVNIIAELLAMEKSVLFVSEKMAALEVVKSRLDSIGLGNFCLELHSRKSNKKKVLDELKRTLNLNDTRLNFSLDKYEEIDHIKSDLNHYNQLIHKPIGQIEFSPFQLFGIKEESLLHFEIKSKNMPSISIENSLEYSSEEFYDSLAKLDNISEILKSLMPFEEMPWRFSNPGVILPSDQETIKSEIKSGLTTLKQINSDLNYLSDISGIAIPSSKNEFDELIEYAIKISRSEIIEKELLKSNHWDQENLTSKEIINNLKEFQNLSSKFITNVLDKDIQSEINDFNSVNKNLFSIPSDIFFPYKNKTLNDIESLITWLNDLNKNIELLMGYSGIIKPNNLSELDESINNASKIGSSPIIEPHVLNNPEWNYFNENSTRIIQELQKYKNQAQFLSNFKNGVLDKDLKSINTNFSNLSEKRLKFISGDYKKNKKLLNSFYVGDAPSDDLALISDLESLILCQDLRNKIRESDVVARQLFGSKWISEDSNPEELESLSKWLVEFRTLLNQGKITEKAIEIISTHQNHEIIKDLTLKIRELFNSIETTLMSLRQILIFSLEEPFNFKEMETEINDLKIKIVAYFEIKEKLMSFYVGDAPSDDLALISDLESLILCQDLRNKIRESDVVARQLFGSKWISEDSNPEELESLSKWLVEFRTLLNQGKITEKAIEIISTQPNPELVQKQIDQIKIDYETFLNNLKTLNNHLNFDCENLFKLSVSGTNFLDLELIMDDFDNELYKLSLWSQYLSLKNENLPLVEPILKLAERDLIDPDDLVFSLKGNFAESILKEVFLETPELRNFVGDLHDSKIQKFLKLDEELLKVNRKRIEHKLSQNRPDSYFSSPNSELGVLIGQFNRKRRHMPIRKLLASTGGVIRQIKPCFMMSPLSIAQFIDPQSIANQKFDVVIFDEASQVKPEDALGALLRGKQLIVMGDTKQLPPTSFFDTMVDAEEEDEELATLVDTESILHFCKISFPTKMLKWHYRSRHESLIAVSNQEFYDNQLFIYPSPCHNSEKIGLQFVHLEDAIYDRGNSSRNIEEAKAVVQAAFEHYEKYGYKKSLGIGTFNTNQQNAILEILELELKRNPKLEQYFTSGKEESFFVKNLETIQGDERDVILISVGFGFDSNHKLNQNFGPLNKDGGERRLNVLATRAREKCVVFSNFLHSDLNIGPNSPFGLRSLKVFLEYAKTKNLVSVVSPGEDTDSPFEDSVYKFLTENGFEVHKQVGCAGFRIDLAIVDPKHRGRYLLGIECDGATYHSSKVARDRDRLRQQILEGLGWNIHRIWSTDWFRNRKGSILKLFSAIEDAKTNKILPSKKKEIEEPESGIETVDIQSQSFEFTEKSETGNILEYELCNSLKIGTDCDLHEKSVQELSYAIKNIVKVEGPVHFDEVVRRIRTHWGLKKAGKRIRDHLSDSVGYTENIGEIIVSNDFLYMKNAEIVVRKRTGDPPAKIELISNEEIAEAIRIVLKRQFATPQDELITAVAKTFGFKSTRKNTAQKINEVINNLITEKELVEMPNGSINLFNN